MRLNDGLADIAAGNLMVTNELEELVDFFALDDKLVKAEPPVTGPASSGNASIDDLAGRTVHVRQASS